MGADEDQMARIQARLYALVSANPGGPDADQARSILARMPHHTAGEALPGMRPATKPDASPVGSPRNSDETGPMFQPFGYGQATGRESPGARSPHVPFTDIKLPVRPQAPQDVLHPPARRPDSELEADPLLQEGVGQAMTMPALHLVGLGLSSIGRKLMQTEGGQAARFLADEGLPIREPTKPFGPTSDVDALEHAADPEIARARDALRFKAPHMGDLGAGGAAAYALLHAGHAGLSGVPALALAAGRNLSPLAGRLALPLARSEAAALPLGMVDSPLLQAASGGTR